MATKYKNNFWCTILSPKNTLFESNVNSIFIIGDRTEYELLAYHYPLVGLVQKGDIIVDWIRRIPIRSGILRFFANECTILIEETPESLAAAKLEIKQKGKA